MKGDFPQTRKCLKYVKHMLQIMMKENKPMNENLWFSKQQE